MVLLPFHAARADDTDSRLNALQNQLLSLEGRLASTERENRALQTELHDIKRSFGKQGRETSPTRYAATKAPPAQVSPAQVRQAIAAQSPSLPVIPPGYALVPAAPGATPGTVVLARAEPPQPPLSPGTFKLGGVTVTLGGFIEAAGIYRSRNEVADVGSSFNTGMPLPNSPLYHENEFRGSARQSRLSLLVQADPNPVSHLAAYYETDFLGAAPTANSVESNSYNLRLRQAYAQYDRKDWGFHFLGGQAWSLLTMNKAGIIPRQEDIPLTIDAQYAVGFTWARQWQVRVAKDFDDQKYWIGLSLENPQTNYYTGPNGAIPASVGTANTSNPGGSLFASTTNYSDEIAPDVILKVTADPGFGHYEAYGLMRFLHDRVSLPGTGHNNTMLAGGGGAGMILPVVPHLVDFQASFLGGAGIGRYGSAQLPDAVLGADGSPKPLPEIEAMVGLVAHPTPKLTLYGYGGTEQIGARYFASGGKGYGYGSPLYSNTSCDTELGSASACVANTSGVVQGTAGFWWNFLHGWYGTASLGMQYSYTHRQTFGGQGSTPSTDENMVFVSFR